MARTKKDEFNESLDKTLIEKLERELLEHERNIIENGSIVRIVEEDIFKKQTCDGVNTIVKVGWYSPTYMRDTMEDMGFKYLGGLPFDMCGWDYHNSCAIECDVFECPKYNIGGVRYISVRYSVENMVEYNDLRGRHYGYKHDEPLIRLENIAYSNGAVVRE